MEGCSKSYKNELEKGLVASYKILKLTAKCGKPHTIDETLIIPAVKELISTVMPTQKDVTPSIPLSDSSVSARIDELQRTLKINFVMNSKQQNFLYNLTRQNYVTIKALLLAYMCFVNTRHEVIEEFLFTEQLEVDTKGPTIYKTVEQFFKLKRNSTFKCYCMHNRRSTVSG